MKHALPITAALVALFVASQVIGLFIVEQYIYRGPAGAVYEDLPYGLETPAIEESWGFVFILGGVLAGTALVLLLVKFRKLGIWRVWFFLSATLALSVAFAPFLGELLAFLLAAGLSFFKVFKPHVLVHNASELFLYGGIAAIFVPMLNVLAVTILLVLISIYDAYAVWKSKHMVTMAKFQAESKVFAGLLIPKKQPAKRLPSPKSLTKPSQPSAALLGGGDIAFPLLFTAVVMKEAGFILPLFVIPLCSAIALTLLLLASEKGKFYPAMPFISAGTFAGYALFVTLI